MDWLHGLGSMLFGLLLCWVFNPFREEKDYHTIEGGERPATEEEAAEYEAEQGGNWWE